MSAKSKPGRAVVPRRPDSTKVGQRSPVRLAPPGAPSGSEFKIKFFVEVHTSRHSGVNLTCDGVFPILPAPKMWIVALKGDDYRQVEAVYYSRHEGLTVYLKFEDQAISKRMIALGWRDADK